MHQYCLNGVFFFGVTVSLYNSSVPPYTILVILIISFVPFTVLLKCLLLKYVFVSSASQSLQNHDSAVASMEKMSLQRNKRSAIAKILDA